MPSWAAMFALLLTGPPGSGKSEVAASLHDSLGDQGIDAALVEVDALERSHPPIERERAISHLSMIAGSYRDIGTDLILITATVEDGRYLTDALEATGADAHAVARLEAEPETLRERILAREPPGWGGLPDLLNASRRLAASMKELAAVDVIFTTEGKEPAEVAAHLEALLRERQVIPP